MTRKEPSITHKELRRRIDAMISIHRLTSKKENESFCLEISPEFSVFHMPVLFDTYDEIVASQRALSDCVFRFLTTPNAARKPHARDPFSRLLSRGTVV